MNRIDLRSILTQYDLEDLLLWILSTSVHPANQAYQRAFETLLSTLLVIPPRQFAGKALARRDLTNLIDNFNALMSGDGSIREDWDPFSQMKPISYVSNGSKFHFFYGILERPYEYLRQFENIFVKSGEPEAVKESLLLKKVLRRSLEFQTRVVTRLLRMDEARIHSDSIYIPSSEFRSEMSQLFRIGKAEKADLICLPLIKVGKTEGGTETELLTERPTFQGLQIQVSPGSSYYLMPQLHTEVLYEFAGGLINNSSRRDTFVSLSFKGLENRLRRRCYQFFTGRSVLAGILQAGTNRDLTGSADPIVRFDRNKIFLFKAAAHSFETDISQQMEVALRELKASVERLKAERILGLQLPNGEVIAVPADQMEFWAVLVFESTTIDASFRVTRELVDENTWIVNMMDLERILEILPSPMSLLKFLRNDSRLHKRATVTSIDYLDRFSYYVSNGESYTREGIVPEWIVFEPHSWHHFFHDKLFERHKDNAYELIERASADTYNVVRKHSNSLYEVVDTSSFNGGLVVKHCDHLVWIRYPPGGVEHLAEEIRSYSGLIGPLYADYLDKLRPPLTQLLGQYGFCFEHLHCVEVYPSSYVSREKKPGRLTSYLGELTREKPLLVVAEKISGSKGLRASVIFDNQFLPDLFAPEDNYGERLCVRELVIGLLRVLDPKMATEEANRKADDFVSLHVPVRAKGYSLEILRTRNPRLEEYPSHQDLSDADVSEVNREIADLLASTGVSPGVYTGKKARDLNNDVYRFLQMRLENELSKYNQSVLFLALREVELIEGQREKDNIQFGIDAAKHIEYDIVQRNLDKTSTLSRISVASKHVTQTILKRGITGDRAITGEDWAYILALGVVITVTAQISDNINSNIAPVSFHVSAALGIKDLQGQASFDIEAFHLAEAARRVGDAQRVFQRSRITEQNQESKVLVAYPDIWSDLNRAFTEEMGFSFDTLALVLYCLGVIDQFSEAHFPLSLVDHGSLVERVVAEGFPPLDKAEVEAVLMFTRLDFGTYQHDDDLIPSRLTRKKERLNLCPLIDLGSTGTLYGNQMCLNSFHLWSGYVSAGEFPYPLPTGSGISSVLSRLHKRLDRDLEERASRTAEDALGREKVESRIDNFRRICPGFPAKPDCGEIDLLCVSPQTKIVHVLDAKNRRRRFRALDIKEEMKQFFDGDRSYLAQIRKKEKFISDHLDEVLKHFSVSDRKDWRVESAFVVDTVYPSAFSAGKLVKFVLLRDLGLYLRGEAR